MKIFYKILKLSDFIDDFTLKESTEVLIDTFQDIYQEIGVLKLNESKDQIDEHSIESLESSILKKRE